MEATSDRASLEQLLRDKRVFVVLGAGGVGKTTSSIALAFAAARQGKKVALLSIDPAKRLADALGIKLSGELTPINLEGTGVAGEIHGAMLDQKAVFDSMVQRHAPTPKVAEKILAHPVYIAASTNLSGPLEYMALAKLADLVGDSSYDAIVLDTPPDTHALDFLRRPNVLGGFMESKVMTWLVKPFALAGKFGVGKLFSVGEKLMGGLAQVTGVNALRTMAEFLVLIQEVIDGFHATGERIVRLLKQPNTAFCLVTVPTHAAVRSAKHINNELQKMGYKLNLTVLNRCLPVAVTNELGREDLHRAVAGEDTGWLTNRHDGEIKLRAQASELFLKGGGDKVLVTVHEQPNELHNVQAILQFVDDLTQA